MTGRMQGNLQSPDVHDVLAGMQKGVTGSAQ